MRLIDFAVAVAAARGLSSAACVVRGKSQSSQVTSFYNQPKNASQAGK